MLQKCVKTYILIIFFYYSFNDKLKNDKNSII